MIRLQIPRVMQGTASGLEARAIHPCHRVVRLGGSPVQRLERLGKRARGFALHLQIARVDLLQLKADVRHGTGEALGAQHVRKAQVCRSMGHLTHVARPGDDRHGLHVPPELCEACEAAGVALFSTPLLTSTFISQLQAYLSEQLAPSTSMHGVALEVFSVGVLILGPSGVGKSECVVELVRRGERMVADDVVRLSSSGDRGNLIGRSPETIRHHIEIRGLGLLCVADLFGADSVLDACQVDLVCRLEGWREGGNYERIGIERPLESFLGIAVPTVTLPVHAASSLATLVELAARDWKLRQSGINAAQRLDERLRKRGRILGAPADEPTDTQAPTTQAPTRPSTKNAAEGDDS